MLTFRRALQSWTFNMLFFKFEFSTRSYSVTYLLHTLRHTLLRLHTLFRTSVSIGISISVSSSVSVWSIMVSITLVIIIIIMVMMFIKHVNTIITIISNSFTPSLSAMRPVSSSDVVRAIDATMPELVTDRPWNEILTYVRDWILQYDVIVYSPYEY